MVSVSQHSFMILWRASNNSIPPYLSTLSGIPSTPGDLLYFRVLMYRYTSSKGEVSSSSVLTEDWGISTIIPRSAGELPIQNFRDMLCLSFQNSVSILHWFCAILRSYRLNTFTERYIRSLNTIIKILHINNISIGLDLFGKFHPPVVLDSSQFLLDLCSQGFKSLFKDYWRYIT